MVSIFTTPLESRKNAHPYKAFKPRSDCSHPRRRSNPHAYLPESSAYSIRSMADFEDVGVQGRSASISDEEARDPTIANSLTPPTPLAHEHVVRLSSLEHCMPRAYIRVCLAYKVPTPEAEAQALQRLKAFVRRIIDAKPYLAGWVVAAKDPEPQEGKVEVRFTLDDLDHFPTLQIRRLSPQEVPFDYEELDRMCLPPSVIKPELVAALPEAADEDRAPVLRVQANLVNGGIIVSFYLHHCISDGTGMGLLISGDIVNDDLTFKRDLQSTSYMVPELDDRLACFAKQMSVLRSSLSWSSPNLMSQRYIQSKQIAPVSVTSLASNPPGRGCIFTFPTERLATLKSALEEELARMNPSLKLSKTDVLQTLLWHHMTSARIPSLHRSSKVTSSKLLTPVNIRKKLDNHLYDNYFGAAVDFSSAELSLGHLQKSDHASMTMTAIAVHEAIEKVDEAYVRAAIALSNSTDPTIDVRDLQASNMDRKTGADMYITSWKGLPLYDAELDLGLGKPDWVRKPWSRDPGSCIILPRNSRKEELEVVVQMTVDDMARLLEDTDFMAMTSNMIE